jgi:cytoskeletal protein CcmA (bactofilin family)
MSDYTKTTNFAAKDSLPSGNSGKIVKGSEIDTEFTNIQTAVATKLNSNNGALTGTTTASALTVSGNIDVDGTSNLDVVDIDGAVDMASTLAVGGVVTANAGIVVDNITIDGTEIDLSSGDLTIDVAGDINLDAGGDSISSKAAERILEISPSQAMTSI